MFSSDGVAVVAGDSGERLDVVRNYPSDGINAMRRLELSDVDTRVRWLRDPRTAAQMNAPTVTVEGTRTWMMRSRTTPGRKDFVVYEISTGVLIAMVGIRGPLGDRTPEVHIFVDPGRHGEGLGTAAMRLVLEWMRTSREFDGCWLTVDPENTAAVRLYSGLGFEEHGTTDLPSRIRMAVGWAEAR